MRLIEVSSLVKCIPMRLMNAKPAAAAIALCRLREVSVFIFMAIFLLNYVSIVIVIALHAYDSHCFHEKAFENWTKGICQ